MGPCVRRDDLLRAYAKSMAASAAVLRECQVEPLSAVDCTVIHAMRRSLFRSLPEIILRGRCYCYHVLFNERHLSGNSVVA
jgi:hypothetical protein